MSDGKLMDNNWIIPFLKKGTFLGNLKIHTKMDNAYKILGKPKDKFGTDEWGWLVEFSNGIRIGCLDDSINEIAILFEKKNIKYSIKITTYEKTLSVIKYIDQITPKTTIHEFIRVLHYNKIKWKSCDERSHDCLSIITEGNVLIMFKLDDGKLHGIVYSDLTIALGKAAFNK